MGHKRIKRIVSLMFSLIFAVGCIGVTAPAAELKAENSVTYEKVISAGTLTGNGALNNATGSRFYASFGIKLQEITQIAEVWKNNQYAWDEDGWDVDVLINGEKSVADVDYNSAGELSFFIYHKDELLQGATVKVRKGQYKPKGINVTCGLEFTQDYFYIWTGEKLVPAHAVPFKETQSDGWNHTSGYAWNFGLTESIAAFAAIDNFWDYNCWALPVYINGVQKSVEMRYANSKFDMMGTGLDSEPSDGTTITIPAGGYLSDGNNYAIVIEKDYDYKWNAKEKQWKVFEKVSENVVSFKMEHQSDWWTYDSKTGKVANKFYLTKEITAFNGIKDFWSLYPWSFKVQIGKEIKTIQARYADNAGAFDFIFDAKPDTGTKITIFAGDYMSEVPNGQITPYKLTIDKDYIFTWDGTKWGQEIVITTLPVSFAGSMSQYGKDTYWGIKVYLSEKIEALSGCKWDTDYWNVPVRVKDTEQIFKVNYDKDNTAFDFFTTAFTGIPEKGTTFKIPAGKYVSFGATKYGIEFTQEYIFYYDGSEWLYAKYDPEADVAYSDVSLTGKISTPIFSKAGKYWSLTTTLSEKITRVADYEWDTDGINVKVLVDDQPYDAIANLLGRDGETETDRIAFQVSNINDGIKAERGTKFTILQGSYKARNFGYGITIDKDYTVYWDGEAWVEELAEIPYYAIALTGKTPWSGYKETYWEVTFSLIGKIPELADCEWNTDYWKVPVVLNGETKVMNVNYDRSNTRLDFFSTELKDTPAKGTVLKIPAGQFMSESGKYGIEFKEEFTFTWDGTTWNGSGSTVSTTESSNTSGNLMTGVQSPKSGDTNPVLLWAMLCVLCGMILTGMTGRMCYKTRKRQS